MYYLQITTTIARGSESFWYCLSTRYKSVCVSMCESVSALKRYITPTHQRDTFEVIEKTEILIDT